MGLGLPVNPSYDTATAVDQSAQTAIEEALLRQASQASDWETTQDQIEQVRAYPAHLVIVIIVGCQYIYICWYVNI